MFPGDPIAMAEEFQSGPGTYEEEGQVYAARIGVLDLDGTEFIARVRPVTRFPVTLQEGDVVLGTVQAIRTSMCIVEVRAHAQYPGRAIASETNGTLHVSKASEDYVDRLEDVYHLGDLVRAEVVGTDPSLQLSTVGPHYGILRSFCPRCRAVMAAKGKGLVCPECDWKETGKIARDYGRGAVLPQREAVAEESAVR